MPQELSGWLLRKPDAETCGGGPAKAARVWAALRQTTLCLYASREAEQDGRALEWVVLSATTEVGRSAVSPAAFVLRGGGRELVLSVVRPAHPPASTTAHFVKSYQREWPSSHPWWVMDEPHL